jgi:hypothetical protein
MKLLTAIKFILIFSQYFLANQNQLIFTAKEEIRKVGIISRAGILAI